MDSEEAPVISSKSRPVKNSLYSSQRLNNHAVSCIYIPDDCVDSDFLLTESSMSLPLFIAIVIVEVLKHCGIVLAQRPIHSILYCCSSLSM